MKSYLLLVALGMATLCAQSPSPAFTAYPVPFFPFQAGPNGILFGVTDSRVPAPSATQT